MGTDTELRYAEPLTAVGVVAPAWMQEPLAVLLEAAPNTRLWASALTAEALLLSATDEPPDVVLLHIPGRDAGGALSLIRSAWPDTRRIVLLEDPGQRRMAEEAGAEVVLYHGVAPGRLMEAITSPRGVEETVSIERQSPKEVRV